MILWFWFLIGYLFVGDHIWQYDIVQRSKSRLDIYHMKQNNVFIGLIIKLSERHISVTAATRKTNGLLLLPISLHATIYCLVKVVRAVMISNHDILMSLPRSLSSSLTLSFSLSIAILIFQNIHFSLSIRATICHMVLC